MGAGAPDQDDRPAAIQPQGPVLVVSERPDSLADRLRTVFVRRGWRAVAITDESRLRWVATVQKPFAIVIVASGEPWTSRILTVARGATTAGIVLVGDVTAERVVTAIRGGTDLVVSDGARDEEIFARILALLRRTSIVHEPGVRYLRSGPLEVDLSAETVTLEGQPVRASPTEYKLLVYLMRHAGRVVPGVQLLDRVWGGVGGDGANTLRIAVTRLRRKLLDDAQAPRFIKSVHGRGYTFDGEVVEQSDDGPAYWAQEQTQLLDSITRIADAVADCPDQQSAAQVVVRSLVNEASADAAAIHRVSRGKLWLLAHDGLSNSWASAVGPSVDLRPSFASTQAVKLQEPVQFAAGATERRTYSDTADLLRGEGFEVGVFLPLCIAGNSWGCLGVLRRSGRSFSPSTLAYLRSVGAVLSASLSREAKPGSSWP